MACDATARLYDVDEDTVVFKKHDKQKSYDQGTIQFRARKGRLIDLDKLHESVWATRLSGGTRSGLVSLQVTTVGRVVSDSGRVMVKVKDSAAEFLLEVEPGEEDAGLLDRLVLASEQGPQRVTGVVAGYSGRWPDLLKRKVSKPRRLYLKAFEDLE